MVSCKRQQPLERMLASIFFWSTMSRSGDSGMRVCSHLVGESAARAEHCRRASRQKDSGPAVARGVFRVTWHSGISFIFFLDFSRSRKEEHTTTTSFTQTTRGAPEKSTTGQGPTDDQTHTHTNRTGTSAGAATGEARDEAMLKVPKGAWQEAQPDRRRQAP